jgi:two-component system phosphate regulon sensor histidine kinase PhoR
MRSNSRVLWAIVILFLLFIFFLSGLNVVAWREAVAFTAGVLLVLGLSRILTPDSPIWEKTSPAPMPEPAVVVEDDRSIFIPGRNFEEMLDRLGSQGSMLNVVLNSMGEGVMLLNQADRVVLMNPSAQKILGLSEKDGVSKHYLEVVRNPVLADLLTQSKKEGNASGEFEMSGREERHFALSAAAIRVDGGTLLGQIVVFSDITSIKKLMRMRTEFVANVSHELKTPLTAILGYVETLLEGAIDDKKNRVQFLGKISDQAQRLNALITDVLELSKIESGTYVSSLESVDASEVAGQALELLKAKAEAKEIVFDQQIPTSCMVTAHREGLFHVFENLIDNAVKYSPRKTVIRLASNTREDGRMELSVEDQGPGIPKEVQNRVFERFFRVDVSRSREAGGTGLGLAIVKHLMDKMRGEVALTSEEGKGSVFTLILPKPSI